MNNRLIVLFAMCLGIFACSGGDVDDTATPTPSVTSAPGSTSTPSPVVIPTPEPVAKEVLFDSFEDGWGYFLDGGLNADLSSENVFSGDRSVRLHGDSGVRSSFILREPIDLSYTESLNLNFWVYGSELSDGDALYVEFSDGTQWQTLSRLVKGVDFGNGTFFNVDINILKDDYTFSEGARLRFTSETSANSIYIDDIAIDSLVYDSVPVTPNYDSSFTFDHIGVVTGCIGCHDNRIAEGKSISHFTSSDNCQLCHIANNVDGWDTLTYFTGTFDHADITSSCSTCHNSILATGKDALHIDASNTCEQCHSPSLGDWVLYVPGGVFPHTDITTGCASCHNNEVTTGKSETHIISSDNCESCHTPNTGWSSATAFTHDGIVDNCVSCHNGVIAEGKDEFHIPASDECETCHSPGNGWWLDDDVFDHGTIVTNCIACHNNIIISGKSSNHIPSSDNCESCHTVGGQWNQVEVFNHEGITTGCVACHNNVTNEGKGEFHIASSDNCEGCHVPNQGWVIEIGPSFSHDSIVEGCLNCHNNTVTIGQSESHIPSGDNCESCHEAGITWDITAFAHEGITSGCSTCHNDVIAEGKSNDHVPSLDTCETCHLPNSGWVFEPLQPFVHTGINSSCVTCHNGELSTGKSATHVPSSNACEDCHNAGGDWLDAKFLHVGITVGCIACHDGGISVGKTATHIPSSTSCETCHIPNNNWEVTVVSGFDHLNVTSNCSTCHDGSIAEGKSINHVPSSNACETCHTPGGDWTDATFDHDGITAGCSFCHDGGISIGKPIDHFSTILDCSSCHTPVTFVSAVFAHPSTSAYPGDHNADLACIDCHTENQDTVTWSFSSVPGDLDDSCAGCHAEDFVPEKHEYTLSESQNCAGTCHIPIPWHSVGRDSFSF